MSEIPNTRVKNAMSPKAVKPMSPSKLSKFSSCPGVSRQVSAPCASSTRRQISDDTDECIDKFGVEASSPSRQVSCDTDAGIDERQGKKLSSKDWRNKFDTATKDNTSKRAARRAKFQSTLSQTKEEERPSSPVENLTHAYTHLDLPVVPRQGDTEAWGAPLPPATPSTNRPAGSLRRASTG